MRNKEFSTQIYTHYLRERAREEAEAEEFHPEEHTFWHAAERLEDLEEMFSCLNEDKEPTPSGLASILEKLVNQLKFGGREYKYTPPEENP